MWPRRAAAARNNCVCFLAVSLVIDTPDLFPDNWIYVHSPEVQLVFQDWSPEMVPDPEDLPRPRVAFVFGQGPLDRAGRPADRARRAGDRSCASLPRQGRVRQRGRPHGEGLSVYDAAFQAAVTTLRVWLSSIRGVQQVGHRNGQHRYNNQDHSMLTAIFAARNVLGARHDVWNVNVDAGEYTGPWTASSRRRSHRTHDPVA